MSEIETIRALIERAKTDAGAVCELEELQCLMLAWTAEQNRAAGYDVSPKETAFACLVRFDRHEARMLDLVAKGSGVTSHAAAQRLAVEGLFHREARPCP